MFSQQSSKYLINAETLIEGLEGREGSPESTALDILWMLLEANQIEILMLSEEWESLRSHIHEKVKEPKRAEEILRKIRKSIKPAPEGKELKFKLLLLSDIFPARDRDAVSVEEVITQHAPNTYGLSNVAVESFFFVLSVWLTKEAFGIKVNPAESFIDSIKHWFGADNQRQNTSSRMLDDRNRTRAPSGRAVPSLQSSDRPASSHPDADKLALSDPFLMGTHVRATGSSSENVRALIDSEKAIRLVHQLALNYARSQLNGIPPSASSAQPSGFGSPDFAGPHSQRLRNRDLENARQIEAFLSNADEDHPGESQLDGDRGVFYPPAYQDLGSPQGAIVSIREIRIGGPPATGGAFNDAPVASPSLSPDPIPVPADSPASPGGGVDQPSPEHPIPAVTTPTSIESVTMLSLDTNGDSLSDRVDFYAYDADKTLKIWSSDTYGDGTINQISLVEANQSVSFFIDIDNDSVFDLAISEASSDAGLNIYPITQLPENLAALKDFFNREGSRPDSVTGNQYFEAASGTSVTHDSLLEATPEMAYRQLSANVGRSSLPTHTSGFADDGVDDKPHDPSSWLTELLVHQRGITSPSVDPIEQDFQTSNQRDLLVQFIHDSLTLLLPESGLAL